MKSNVKKAGALLLVLATLVSSITVCAAEVNPSSASIPITGEVSEYYFVAAPATIALVRDDAMKFSSDSLAYYGLLSLGIYGKLQHDGGVQYSIKLPELSDFKADETTMSQLSFLSTASSTAATSASLSAIQTNSEKQGSIVGYLSGNDIGSATLGIDMDSLQKLNASSEVGGTALVKQVAYSSIGTSAPDISAATNSSDMYLIYTKPNALGTYSGNITINFSRFHDSP